MDFTYLSRRIEQGTWSLKPPTLFPRKKLSEIGEEDFGSCRGDITIDGRDLPDSSSRKDGAILEAPNG